MRAIDFSLRIFLIGVYALVIWKGIELSRFAFIKQRADSISSHSRQDIEKISTQANDLEKSLSDWQSVRGVESDAAFASIAMKRALSPTPSLNLEPEAISVLKVRPMSAQAWALMAGTRLVHGQPVEKVASALQTALMLAPNEDDLIADRLIYGLIIWEYLTPSAKDRISADLMLVGQLGETAELQKVRTIVAQKDLAFRKDIRGRLETRQAFKSFIDGLGL